MKGIIIEREKRLCDAISFRISPEMRDFLERTAEIKDVGLCEATRSVIKEAMANSGVSRC